MTNKQIKDFNEKTIINWNEKILVQNEDNTYSYLISSILNKWFWFKYITNVFSELPSIANENDLWYVKNDEWTKWFPWNFWWTYYSAGIYIYQNGFWIWNKQEIEKYLENAQIIKKHWIDSWVTTFLTQWTPNYTFNLSSFDYYINWIKYKYTWWTNINPWFLPWENFAYIWVNSYWWLVIKKNSYFTISESENTILIWIVRSTIWWVNWTLDIINDYVYYWDEIWKKIYTRYKNFEKTLFNKSAWLISVFWLRPTILWWYYNNDNLDNAVITPLTDFPYSYIYHVSWQYFIWPSQSQDINVNQYDNWTDLVSTSNNKFVSHTVLRSNINWAIFIVIWELQHDTQLWAEQSPANYWPLEHIWWWSLVALAKIIYKKWVWIVNVIDIRNNVTWTPSISSWTLQNSYDASVNPEIITDNTKWAFSVKWWSWIDTDNIFEWLNNSWIITSKIDANWVWTFTKINADNIVQKIATITNIDFKNIQLINLFTVPTWKTFIPTQILLKIKNISWYTTSFTASIWDNDSSYNNFAQWFQLTSTATNAIQEWILSITPWIFWTTVNWYKYFPSWRNIKLNITVWATATTLTWDIDVIWYYE